MLEIFRMQLRHMLGGKRKWLVALCLVLPVLLTLAVVSSGGIGDLERELERERSRTLWAQGKVAATARLVAWEGTDQQFAGGLTLTRDGVLHHGHLAGKDMVIVVNDGQVLLLDGKLWVDPSKANRRQGMHLQFLRRDADAADAVPPIDTVCAIYLFLLFPQAICLLLALFYGTSVLGDELDGKTLTYLFTRPLPRWQFVVGKYLGIATALLLPTSLSVLAAWLVLGSPGGAGLLGAILVGTAFAVLAYNALFVLFGFLVPRRAMIVALLYGVLFEVILSFVPALVNGMTITYYLRSLVVAMLDIKMPREIAPMVGGATPATAVLALGAIIAGSLAAASLLAARKEYVVKDSA